MNYKERLVLEFKDLVEKREILERTLNSDEPTCFDEEVATCFDEEVVKLLRDQLAAMQRYEEILFIRITSMMK